MVSGTVIITWRIIFNLILIFIWIDIISFLNLVFYLNNVHFKVFISLWSWLVLTLGITDKYAAPAAILVHQAGFTPASSLCPLYVIFFENMPKFPFSFTFQRLHCPECKANHYKKNIYWFLTTMICYFYKFSITTHRHEEQEKK